MDLLKLNGQWTIFNIHPNYDKQNYSGIAPLVATPLKGRFVAFLHLFLKVILG